MQLCIRMIFMNPFCQFKRFITSWSGRPHIWAFGFPIFGVIVSGSVRMFVKTNQTRPWTFICIENELWTTFNQLICLTCSLLLYIFLLILVGMVLQVDRWNEQMENGIFPGPLWSHTNESWFGVGFQLFALNFSAVFVFKIILVIRRHF